MLNFVNFQNGGRREGEGSCVHRRILEVMLRNLSNLLIAKLTDKSAYINVRLFRGWNKMDKMYVAG